MNSNVNIIQEVLNTYKEMLQDTWAFEMKSENDELFMNSGSDWKLITKEQCLHLSKMFSELAENIPDTDANRTDWLNSLKVGDTVCYKQYLPSDDIELVKSKIDSINGNSITLENSVVIDKKKGNGYNSNKESILIQSYID